MSRSKHRKPRDWSNFWMSMQYVGVAFGMPYWAPPAPENTEEDNADPR